MAQSYWKWEEQEVEYFDVIFTYFDGEVELIESFQYSEKKAKAYAEELTARDAKYPDEIQGSYSVVKREEIEDVWVEDINEWW